MKLALIFGYSAALAGSSIPPLDPLCGEALTQKHYGEVEAHFQSQPVFRDAVARERLVLERMKKDPAGYYFELRTKARKELKSGKDDFRFAPLTPVIARIAIDLNQRKTRKFGDKHSARLTELEGKARALLAGGDVPYKAAVRFIMNEYNPMLDTLFGERHPGLMGGEFHKHHAEHLLEKFLAKAPDVLMMFSFEPVDFDFFLRTRPAPFQLVGLDLRGLDDSGSLPFADGYQMKPSEFSWHDLGHIDFMAFRDVEYIEGADKPITRIIWEWESTRRRIKAMHDQVSAQDKILGDAVEMVLSELLHERGFQYSLTVLKQELETPKWIRAILRKKAKGFYGQGENLEATVLRLEEARQALYDALLRIRDEDQMSWNRTLRADVVPVHVIHTPKLGYVSGTFERLEFREVDKPRLVCRDSSGTEIATSIREFLSVQVNPTKQSPFSERVKSRLAKLLWAKNNDPRSKIDFIYVDGAKSIRVVFTNGTTEALAKVTPPPNVPKIFRRFENLDFFEMEQVLGAAERGETLEFGVRPATQVYVGTIQTEKQLLTGLHKAAIKTSSGQTFTMPLNEIRVDPLTGKEDLE